MAYELKGSIFLFKMRSYHTLVYLGGGGIYHNP